MVILSAFVAYLLLMIVIGVVYMKKTSSSEDYFLGGRGLNAWVAALSAQASDMSGWLLMGLPGAIYSLGTGHIHTQVHCCANADLRFNLHIVRIFFDIRKSHTRTEAQRTYVVGGSGIALLHSECHIGNAGALVAQYHTDAVGVNRNINLAAACVDDHID